MKYTISVASKDWCLLVQVKEVITHEYPNLKEDKVKKVKIITTKFKPTFSFPRFNSLVEISLFHPEKKRKIIGKAYLNWKDLKWGKKRLVLKLCLPVKTVVMEDSDFEMISQK